MKSRLLIAAALFVSLFTVQAQAADITYNFNNAVFNDGGTLSGSFTFDTSTDTYLSWNITTTATTNPSADGGFSLNGATYMTNNLTSASTSSFINATSAEFKDGSNDTLGILFTGSLVNGSSSLPISGFEFANGGFESRSIAQGTVVASVVPLPAGFPLFATAIVALAFFGLRKTRYAKAF